MIIFVGDKPSTKNIDPNIPFVGTKSYKTLLGWVADMDIFINDIKLINADKFRYYPSSEVIYFNFSPICYKSEATLVALGNNASNKLENLGLNHFKLPHPSGLNRKLNDKKQLKKTLQSCKHWVNSN